MQYDNNEIMTLSEIAEYLKVAERTILRMIHKNEIPCVKIASQWRFVKTIIDDWLISKMQVIPQNDFSRMIEQEFHLIPLSRIIKEENIILNLKAGTKKEILIQLLQPLLQQKIIPQQSDDFLNKLLDRENMASTALGNGIAIPHIRNVKENPKGPILITGICKEGSNFEALDNELTHVFFLLCSDSEIAHLRIMAKISQLFKNKQFFKEFLHQSTKTDIIKIIIKKENELNNLVSK